MDMKKVKFLLKVLTVIVCGIGCASIVENFYHSIKSGLEYQALEKVEEHTNVDLVSHGVYGEHEYIDLGLPSGTKWAVCNVGAEKPTGSGNYFAWGETIPKDDYSFETYKWCANKLLDDNLGLPRDFTKYVVKESAGTVDNKKVLDAEDDAATVNWGNKWRMPTLEEYNELIAGCNWKFTKDLNGTGVAGAIGTSKVNKAKIFLPNAGCFFYSKNLDNGGFYWTSSLSTDFSTIGSHVLSLGNGVMSMSVCSRSYGNSVRAVVK